MVEGSQAAGSGLSWPRPASSPKILGGWVQCRAKSNQTLATTSSRGHRESYVASSLRHCRVHCLRPRPTQSHDKDACPDNALGTARPLWTMFRASGLRFIFPYPVGLQVASLAFRRTGLRLALACGFPSRMPCLCSTVPHSGNRGRGNTEAACSGLEITPATYRASGWLSGMKGHVPAS